MFKESMERIGIKPPGAGYKTSRDYEALWEVVGKGYEVVAFVTGRHGTISLVSVRRPKMGGYSIGFPGHGFGNAWETFEEFIEDCKELDLEFIMPDVES